MLLLSVAIFAACSATFWSLARGQMTTWPCTWTHAAYWRSASPWRVRMVALTPPTVFSLNVAAPPMYLLASSRRYFSRALGSLTPSITVVPSPSGATLTAMPLSGSMPLALIDSGFSGSKPSSLINCPLVLSSPTLIGAASLNFSISAEAALTASLTVGTSATKTASSGTKASGALLLHPEHPWMDAANERARRATNDPANIRPLPCFMVLLPRFSMS